MGNIFGKVFQIATWGESHGKGVGVVIEGCPPGIELSEKDIQKDLDRRKPGQSTVSTPRKEEDVCEILSGVFEGKTLGTPISIWVRNENVKSEDYEELKEVYRPSHADFTYEAKYGVRDWRGGGRAAARETVGRVAGGAVARCVLEKLMPGADVMGFMRQVGNIVSGVDVCDVKREVVEGNAVRWPKEDEAEAVRKMIEEVRSEGDSLGGVVECIVRGVPAGLGEPVFDKFEADLAKGMLSLPACKGFEVGSGFESTRMKGSEHNDVFVMKEGKVGTETNRSGGVQGGITNGEPIVFRTAFKPTASILKEQKTVSLNGKAVELKVKGRHDPCVLPRVVPIVEAMVWLVLADHVLRQRGQCGQIEAK